MKVLLDTHVLIWALTDPLKLSPQAANILLDSNTSLLVSSATVWELGIKFQIGKLPQVKRILPRLEHSLARLGADELRINHAHALKASCLSPVHRDPFDRMLVAQAVIEGVPLMTADQVFQGYQVLTVW